MHLVLGLLLLASASAAVACSCWRPTHDQLLETYPLIFAGQVAEVDQKAGIATFEVARVYKGVVSSARTAIRFNNGPGSACGISFSVGERATVFASYHPAAQGSHFMTGLCDMLPYRSSPQRFQPALDAYALQVEAARKVVEGSPQSARALGALAAIQEAKKDHLALLKTLEVLAKLSPKDATVPARTGVAYLEIGHHAQALEAFDAALALNGKLASAQRGRDQALLKLGRVAELDPARRDFSGMALSKADFSGRQLAGANFSKAQLTEPSFANANLADANFSGASVDRGSFSGAQLTGARFNAASTYEVNFSGARMPRASFAGAEVRNANFRDADLRNADLTGVRAEGAIFSGADLVNARLNRAYLVHANLSGVDLSGADLQGLELQGVVLRDAKLVNANLAGAMLSGAPKGYRQNESASGAGRAPDLRGTDLTGANLRDADIRYALFDCRTRWPSGFDWRSLPLLPVTSRDCPGPPAMTALSATPGTLREMPGRIGGERATVRGPEIDKVDLSGADLSGLNLSGFRIVNSNLRSATLRGTDFRNADLQNSNLARANLALADLSGATLWGTNFSDADLAGAKLSGASFNASTRWPAQFDPVAAGAELRR